MILILGSVGLAVLFIVFWRLTDSEGLGLIGACLGIVAIIGLLAWYPCICSSRADVIGFTAIKDTVAAARANPSISELELAALQQKIVEQNKLLAREQYWAKNPLTNWFYVREILELEPIK